MSDHALEQKLALQGGMKAVSTIEGKGEPKIGIDEFLAIGERFGFSDETLAKVRAILREEDMGSGPFLARYYANVQETKGQAFARTAQELLGVKYAMGISSGTAALHAAFVAVGVGPGTEVILPAIGFYATAAAVVTSNGVPVFCDVDESLGMDPAKIEALITPRTVAIAPTQVMGSVCNMEAIVEIAHKHGLKVVEDCAQSCGGKYKGKYVGTWGDIGCFSISCYKIVGGGEGGLLITNDERLFERASQLAECGGLWRPVRFDPPRYEGELFNGTNYRMSELEAAVDVVQLGRMPQTVKRFHDVKMRVLRQLKTFSEITPQKLNDPQGEVGYILRFYPASIDLSLQIVEALKAEGISAGTRGHNDRPDWHIYHKMFPITLKTSPTAAGCPFQCPIYLERGGSVSYDRGQCPVADDLFDRVVNVSLNQWFTAEDCDHIANGINKVLSAYCSADDAATPWL
ncbi:MAG: DegT/DnrJ/EryC1/StrS family aminotransferase [Anaerolineae bacterium]